MRSGGSCHSQSSPFISLILCGQLVLLTQITLSLPSIYLSSWRFPSALIVGNKYKVHLNTAKLRKPWHKTEQKAKGGYSQRKGNHWCECLCPAYLTALAGMSGSIFRTSYFFASSPSPFLFPLLYSTPGCFSSSKVKMSRASVLSSLLQVLQSSSPRHAAVLFATHHRQCRALLVASIRKSCSFTV